MMKRALFAWALLTACPAWAQNPPADASSPTLTELLNRHDFQGILLPAETMREGGKSVLSIYRMFEAQDGDVEIIYGYASSDHKSYYRSFALFARQIRFELVRTSDDRSPLMALMREYATSHQRTPYTIHSLRADLTLPPDHRVIATDSGGCNVPYKTWLTLKDTAGQVVSERLVVRLIDPPLPFAEAQSCPMAVSTQRSLRDRTAHMRARSVAFEQAVTLEDGGFLAIASSDSMVVRFDAGLNAPFLGTQPRYAMIEYGAALQHDLVQAALKDAAVDPSIPAVSRYEADMWSLIDGHFGGAPAPKTNSTTKPPKPH
jgi:hypothetical protein